MCIHDTRNSTVVDVAISLANIFDGRDTFLLGLVRQHGTEGDVANDTDVGDFGAIFLIDDNATALVGLDSDIFEAEAGGIGAAADSDEDDIGVELKKWISAWALASELCSS